MKVKIEYDFDENGYYAFYRNQDGTKAYFCSVDNFEIARQKLLDYLKLEKQTVIPEPEEVEL